MATPAVFKFRNLMGGNLPPVVKYAAAGDITVYGTPVFLEGTNNTVAACTDGLTTIFGYAISAGVAGDLIDVIPAYPGIQALMAFDVPGDYALAQVGSFVSLTVSGTSFTVNPNKADADAFKLVAKITDLAGNARAWVEVASTANQTAIEY